MCVFLIRQTNASSTQQKIDLLADINYMSADREQRGVGPEFSKGKSCSSLRYCTPFPDVPVANALSCTP